MNLSIIPLKERTREFLKSENLLGFNKSQYQTEVANRLDKAIRTIFHILKHPYNLKQDDLYDKLNAQTLAAIVEDLLRDVKEKSEYRHEKYDFRTVELARLFFHVSTIYLQKSKLFEKDEFLDEDVRRVANRFYILSRSVFEREQHQGKISQDDEKLQVQLEELKNHEYYKLDKERSRLIKERKNSNKTDYKKISAKIKAINQKRAKADIDLKKKKSKIYEKLGQKYEHLTPFYCPYDRLGEFEYKDIPHTFSQTNEKTSYTYR